ncbi:MAG: hypothetical protein KKE11_05310 [Gammaproteobacteria bacterium]|nr:hypothetical protein [Gammaproteobacteria bacterium]
MIKNKLVFVLLVFLSFPFGCYAKKIDVAGIDPVELIQALYARAQPVSAAEWEIYSDVMLTKEEAQSLVGNTIDRLYGKELKISVLAKGDKNEIESLFYNNLNGDNAAEEAVGMLREGKSIDEIRKVGLSKLQESALLKMIPYVNVKRMINVMSDAGATFIYNVLYQPDDQEMLLSEFIKKCKNPDYTMDDSYKERLVAMNIMTLDGEIFSYLKIGVPKFEAQLDVLNVLGQGKESAFFSGMGKGKEKRSSSGPYALVEFVYDQSEEEVYLTGFLIYMRWLKITIQYCLMN